MKKWLIVISLVIIAIIGCAVRVLFSAMDPLEKAKDTAYEIALKETRMEVVTDFSLYNGSKTYYVVSGADAEGEELIAWIPENGGEIIVKEKDDGISKKEAIQLLYKDKEPDPQKIITVKLGMEDNIPVWEIYYRSNDLMNYYYVSFESGEWYKDIQNL